MQLSSQPNPLAWSGGVLVVPRAAGAAPSSLETALDEKLDRAISAAAERMLFKGRPRQTLAIDTHGRLPAARILLVGTGDGPLGPAAARDLAALAVADALATRHRSVGFALPVGDAATLAVQLSAGALLGAYRWDAYKSKDPESPAAVVDRFDLLTDADVAAALDRGAALANAVNLARTLVNEPPNECTPRRLAALAGELGRQLGLTVTILERPDMEKRQMGGLLAVAQGAQEPPRLIHLAYTPTGAGAGKKPIVFVGKGLTFDSGGLSIKPAKSMEDMYIDMAGGAAVLGLMRAVGELRPDVPVHGIIGATENMPDGNSYRPSDILRMANGKTVEVLNTDAEGRLVLADCLHYASELAPGTLVDLATLTGACMVGLGPNYSGLFTAHDDLAADLGRAADAAGELIWRLPLDKKLADSIKSQRADIKNLGGPYGGAITGALFLQHFVGDLRWAHLDIAGPALADKDDGHIRAGGTGHGVLTLWSLVEQAAR
jgi:leucyl aminopeptidase